MKNLFIVLSLILLMTAVTSCINATEIYNNYPDSVIIDGVAEKTDDKIDIIVNDSDENVILEEEVIKEEKEDVMVEENNEITKPVIEQEINSAEDLTSIDNKTLLATNSTIFDPNLADRSTNVRLAASYINGIVLQPDEEFSFNRIVGERTAERGFKYADIFSGKTVVKGLGGGICQTSSTICGAVRKTTMKIVEQNPHSMRVAYTTIENEAMISYGTSDFRFINTYDFPVLIEFTFETLQSGENINCNIYGLKE